MSKEKMFQVGDFVRARIGNGRSHDGVINSCDPNFGYDYNIVTKSGGVINVYEHELTLITPIFRVPGEYSEWNTDIRHYHEGNDSYGHMRKHNGRVKKFATWVTMTHKRKHHAVIGRSFCSWKDQPNKKTGVRLAKERAHKMIDQIV